MQTRRKFIEQFLKGAGCFALAAGSPSLLARLAEKTPEGTFRFPQGVASGDPTVNSVVLWTRVVSPDSPNSIPLRCEVSTDADFKNRVAARDVVAQRNTDHTVRVLLHDLEPDQIYYYRFLAGGDLSRVGRTRTAPSPDNPRPVRFSWASCQSYEAGYYGIYRTLINQDEAAAPDQQIEFLVHAGDFIYEKLGYGSARSMPSLPSGGHTVGEDTDPFAVSLEDYRHLYRVYLEDPDLQAARARWPFINTWDDHEFTNDCWQSMATYTPLGEPAQTRKVAANRAWFEFIPAFLTGNPGVPGVEQHARDFSPPAIQVQEAAFQGFGPDQIDREPNNRLALETLTIYRSFRWGKQVELIVTDTRSYRTDHPIPAQINQKITGTNNYLCPLPLVRIFDAGRTWNGGNPLQEITFAGQTIPNPKADAPPGTMLGHTQKQWFKDTLKNSDAHWKIWANSVPAMPMRLDLDQVDPESTAIIFTTDTCEGYPIERQELFDFIADEGIANFISLAGDHHNNFAGLLFQDFDAPDPNPIGAEFAVAGISSPSVFHALVYAVEADSKLRALVTFDSTAFGGSEKHVNNLNVTFTHGARAAFTAAQTGDWQAAQSQRNPTHNRHLAYVDSSAYGIAIITVDQDQSHVEMITTAPPVVPPGADGAQILRSAHFTVPATAAGEPITLQGPLIDGIPPFPISEES